MNKDGFSTTKILMTIVIIGLVGIIGYYILTQGESDNYSGQPRAIDCQQYQNDVCDLFECMVDQCWCDDSGTKSPILLETYVEVNNEQDAKDAIYAYIAELMYGEDTLLAEKGSNMEVKNAVKINDIFYNVFIDREGEEIVYTVSKDGQILMTVCGT